MLPREARQSLDRHLRKTRLLHQRDLAEGYGHAKIPESLLRKYPAVALDWG